MPETKPRGRGATGGGTSSGAARPGPLALALCPDAVHLLAQDGFGAWQVVAEASRSGVDSDTEIAALRAEASRRNPKDQPVSVWLSPEHVVSGRFKLEATGRSAARAEAGRRLAEGTPHTDADLCFDVAPALRGQPVTVFGAHVGDVRAAAEEARDLGFVPGPISTRMTGEFAGAWQPSFETPEIAARRARRTTTRRVVAVAAVAVLAIAGLGAYRAADVPLAGPPVLKWGAPAQTVPAVAMADPAPAAPGPSHVRTGTVQELAAAAGPSAAPDRLVERTQRYARPVRAADAPSITQPGESPAPRIGQPTAPERVPSAAPLPVPAEAAAVADASVTRAALDLIRAETLELAQSSRAGAPPLPAPPLEAFATDLVVAFAERIGVRAESRQPGIETRAGAPSVRSVPWRKSVPAEPARETDVEETAGQARSDLAPLAMNAAPPPRPTEESASESASESAPEPAAAAVAEAATAPTPADTAPAADETETPAKEVIAAITAPEPPTRPREVALARAPADGRAGTTVAARLPVGVGEAARKSGIALDAPSLIGVIDGADGRVALVRLPGGEIKKLARGDRLDGWRVNSIGREAIRLSRGGQNRTLLLVAR